MMTEITLSVPDISCENCAHHIRPPLLPILAISRSGVSGHGGGSVDNLLGTGNGRNWLAGIVVVACLGAGVGLAYPLVQRPAAPPVQLVATPPAPTAAPAELQVH